MVYVVSRRQHLRLIDVVDLEVFKNLRLNEVTDASFGHDRNRNRVDDALNQIRVAHTGDATLRSDIRGNALECHNCDGAGVFGNLGLLRRDNVHDDATLEHFCQPALDAV